MFPDIQLNKDAGRPVLSAPPVAVTQELAPQGKNCCCTGVLYSNFCHVHCAPIVGFYPEVAFHWWGYFV
jgi:hypothetical protein